VRRQNRCPETVDALQRNDTRATVVAMRSHQVYGVALFLVGSALLIVSVGIAWTLARRSRAGRVEDAGVITAVSFALFLAGV
jgi:hypothetical protein